MIAELPKLTNKDQDELNCWSSFFSFKQTPMFAEFVNRKEKIVFLCTGNQAFKTSSTAYQYVLRIIGQHPVEEKNMRPWKKTRIYRFASETLPHDDEGEVKNTQYPEFKKWLPPHLIKKDITKNSPKMTIKDIQGGPDIYVEFCSFNQTLQSQAGQQRESVWLDESAGQAFYEEQFPRLNISNGDIVYTLTPALDFKGWEFEELFEKARVIIRSDAVRQRLYERFGEKYGRYQYTNINSDICVIQLATDDNPVYEDVVREISERTKTTVTVKDYLDARYRELDADMVDIRRFGIFKQVSGRIHKNFESTVHVVDPAKIFVNARVPNDGLHCRLIDFHELNPWAIMWIWLSERDEAFVYEEMSPSPERFNTLAISQMMAERSGDYSYRLDLIDPLGEKKQPNSGKSPREDMNDYFMEMKRQGICKGGYFETWDTKSLKGRDEVRKRLENARKVGRPYNNEIVEFGIKRYLPTLWILNHCRETILSIKNWRREQWANRDQLTTKDEKDKAEQKWSHFNMCLEAAFKHPSFRPIKKMPLPAQRTKPEYQGYFQRIGA